MRKRILHDAVTMAAALFLLFHVANIAHAQVLKDLGKGLKATGEFIEKGVDKTGEAIEKGIKQTGDAIAGKDSEPKEIPIVASYLFVQQAGTLTYDDGKLTLGELAPSTFFFTDRPVRDAGHMTHEAFSKLWNDEEKDGFKADPPNAAIAIAGEEATEPLVVELLAVQLSGSELVYKVKVNSGTMPAQAKNVAMFVDAFGATGSGTIYFRASR
ncbi:hypothetical protein [Hoeflea sp. TYP-13]|uniref:hypothetical protein n=1 Tax=Hoeflea sp. TYP-13 TaxID=3230023 RepID=UPI0034C5D249